MTLTVLSWRRRMRCGACGAQSKGRSVAGDMVATVDGWRCPKCAEQAPVDISPAREVEPAPAGDTIDQGVAQLPLLTEPAA